MATAPQTEPQSADILIVDDEDNVRSFLRAFLEREGYTCDTAGNGRDAFRKTNRAEYRLVIMDIRMPDWDGLDAIFSMGMVNPEQRVLVLSGFLDEPVRENLGRTRNVVGSLMKPVNLRELARTVASALNTGAVSAV